MAGLEKVMLYNFRSYNERGFSFSPEVTIITGKNGTGKTNLLEAIHVLYTGKSFRDADIDLVRHKQDWFRVVGSIDGHQRELRYQPDQPVKKSVVQGDQSGKRFTYRHQLPVVLFEPDDILMIHGSPRLRRRYLDELLIKTNPTYRTTVARYERALLQRNNILKRQLPLAQLRDAVFVWDVALAEYGAVIQTLRTELSERLNEAISMIYSTIAGKDQQVVLRYTTKTHGDNQKLANSLAQSLELDRLRGTTSVGPHRDDVELFLMDKPIKQTASRGEARTFVLALKELEIQHIQQTTNTSPLFLLDDVFSELDTSRQKALIKQTNDVQKIITTTSGASLAKRVQEIPLD